MLIKSKNVISLALVLVIIFVVGGCSDQKQGDGTTEQKVEASTQAKKTSEETRTKEEESTKVNYPTKNINITVPYGVGGAGDIAARMVAQYWAKDVGKNVTVTNLPGAGGVIGTTSYVSKPLDAHELLYGGIGLFTIAPLFNSDITFSMDDIKPITGVLKDQFIIYTNPSVSGIRSFEDLINYSKDKKVLFGSTGEGSTNHLLQAALYKMAGIEAETVVGKGGFANMTNLLGGNVDVFCANASLGTDNVKEGNIVPILVLGEESYKGYDGIEVPTAKSLGYDIIFESTNFIVGHKDLDNDTVNEIYNQIMNVYGSNEFIEQAKTSKMKICNYKSERLQKQLLDSVALMKELYTIVYGDK